MASSIQEIRSKGSDRLRVPDIIVSWSSYLAASCSSFSSSHKRSSLFDLMKVGSKSLRRLYHEIDLILINT
jgi:hypothetical protein